MIILSEGNFFNIYILSQCTVYWINFQNMYTFTYQKTLLHTLLLPVFKMVKNFKRILNTDYISPQHFKKNFKDFRENSFCVLEILEISSKTFNPLRNSAMYWALYLALLVFQRQGQIMKLNIKIHFYSCKDTACIKKRWRSSDLCSWVTFLYKQITLLRI